MNTTLDNGIVEARDARGRLIFEYNPASGRAVLHMPGAAVELKSVDGELEISCARSIRIRSGEVVHIEGGKGVKIDAPELEARGERMNLRAREATVTLGKLERVVDRVFDFARNVYQRVEGLFHTRAGRVRVEAERTHLVQAGQARILAKEDVRVQGQSIHLG